MAENRFRDLGLSRRATDFLCSEDGKVTARLVTGIHEDKKLQLMFLDRSPGAEFKVKSLTKQSQQANGTHRFLPVLFSDSFMAPGKSGGIWCRVRALINQGKNEPRERRNDLLGWLSLRT